MILALTKPLFKGHILHGGKKNPTTQMSQKVYVTKSNERLDERRSIWTYIYRQELKKVSGSESLSSFYILKKWLLQLFS